MPFVVALGLQNETYSRYPGFSYGVTLSILLYIFIHREGKQKFCKRITLFCKQFTSTSTRRRDARHTHAIAHKFISIHHRAHPQHLSPSPRGQSSQGFKYTAKGDDGCHRAARGTSLEVFRGSNAPRKEELRSLPEIKEVDVTVNRCINVSVGCGHVGNTVHGINLCY